MTRPAITTSHRAGDDRPVAHVSPGAGRWASPRHRPGGRPVKGGMTCRLPRGSPTRRSIRPDPVQGPAQIVQCPDWPKPPSRRMSPSQVIDQGDWVVQLKRARAGEDAEESLEVERDQVGLSGPVHSAAAAALGAGMIRVGPGIATGRGGRTGDPRPSRRCGESRPFRPAPRRSGRAGRCLSSRPGSGRRNPVRGRAGPSLMPSGPGSIRNGSPPASIGTGAA